VLTIKNSRLDLKEYRVCHRPVTGYGVDNKKFQIGFEAMLMVCSKYPSTKVVVIENSRLDL
jgi:hypothetical protein